MARAMNPRHSEVNIACSAGFQYDLNLFDLALNLYGAFAILNLSHDFFLFGYTLCVNSKRGSTAVSLLLTVKRFLCCSRNGRKYYVVFQTRVSFLCLGATQFLTKQFYRFLMNIFRSEPFANCC